jgi:acyl-CoA-binding protein
MSEQKDEFNIEEVFESAVTLVKSLPKEGPIQPSNDLKLKLYALYKQATCGPNDTPKPYIWQAVEYYKWNAWLKLGDMSREDAMSNYIMELKKIMETIPNDKKDPDESRHFEEVLGKKFYDYCKFTVSPQINFQMLLLQPCNAVAKVI